MKQIVCNEIVLSLALVTLAILFLDPLMFLMPKSVLYVVITLFVLAVFTFVGLVWREQSGDEREELHKLSAGRVGYMSGIVVLLTGIVYQCLHGTTDPWLVAALVAMVLGKLFARYYHGRRG